MGAVNRGFTQSEVNTFRISAVTDGLAALLSSSTTMNDAQFCDLCLSLSRGIDFALAHHEPPMRPLEMVSLLKKVFQIKSDPCLLSAIMVLMFSVKNACQKGWFPESDSKELMNLASEVAGEFGSVPGFNIEPCHPDSTISTVFSRFFPKMKIHHVYAYLDVKPGFDAHLSDFLVEKDERTPPASRFSLFVVQKDNMETSACLITPPKVNFLLNGQGIENRTTGFMDSGPQMPTPVHCLMRFGSNLLQAVGEFNGNYIVAIAHTSEMPHPSSTDLKDYEQLAPATLDADSEVIEDQSQVSINCPLSFKRIKTPVKGHLCKHLTCFDYDNFMEMNSRRPSWRCPHCNQSVCFTDLRLDRKMVEILKHVESAVSEIIISSDGSWSAVKKSDETIQKPENIISEPVNVDSPQPMEVVDLGNIDDELVCLDPRESVDRKNAPTATQDHAVVNYDDTYWSTLFMFTLNQSPMASSLDFNAHASVAEPNALSPDLDSLFGNAQTGASHVSTDPSVPVNPSSQQSPLASSTMSNESRRFSPIPQNVTRTPVAVQALPAQNSVSQRRWRAHGFLVTSQASPSQPTVSNMPLNVDSYRTSSASPSPYSGSQATPPHMAQCHQNIGLNRGSVAVHPFAAPPSLRTVPDMQPSTSTAEQRPSKPSMAAPPHLAGNPSLSPVLNLQSLSQPSMTPIRLQSGISSLRSAPHLRPSMSTPEQQRPNQPSVTLKRPNLGTSSLRPAPHFRSSTGTAEQQRPSMTPATNSYLRPPPHLQNQSSQSSGATQSPVILSSTSPTIVPLNIKMQPVIAQRSNDISPRSSTSGTPGVNLQPTGRMRGALTGQAKTDMYNKFVNPTMQQTQTVSPFSPTAQSFMDDTGLSTTPPSAVGGVHLSPAQQSAIVDKVSAAVRPPGFHV